MAQQAIKAIIANNPYIDGILYGTRWKGAVTYSFADDFSDFGTGYPHNIYGFQQISDQQKLAIQSILQGKVTSGTGAAPFSYGSFSQVSGLKITLAADPNGTSDITIGQTDDFDYEDLGTARVADFPELDQPISGGDVWFGDSYSYRAPVLGNYSWHTHVHEFGHAVGLAHGHNAGTSIEGFGEKLPYDRDSMEFSVMTYRSYIGDPLSGGYSNEGFGYAQTLMMSDIAALQHLYGANFTTNATNTVYTWDTGTGQMFLNGVGQGMPGDNRVFLTIWDGGGIDTYDLSNYTTNALIDLSPGKWSLVSQIQRANLGEGAYANGNIYNAYLYNGDLRSLIENAMGGSGNDEIGGNQGRNSLYGNGGNDVLSGRAGADMLYGGNGNDMLYGDFRAGAAYGGSGLLTEPDGTANNTRDTALDVTAAIGLRTDADILHSDTDPSVKISGKGNGGYDWYAFDVTAPGQIILDTDGGSNFNSLQLYDATGTTPLAYNWYAEKEAEDPRYQSLIVYTVTTPGRYFVKVSGYADQSLGNGDTYILNITVPNPVETGTGAGNDVLNGGAGADKLFGGAGMDTASYAGASKGVAASLAKPSDNTNDAKGDSYAAIENLTGSSFNDRLTGNAGANTLTGGAGNDVLTGGVGKDTLVGGAGTDTASYAGASKGVAASLAKPSDNTNDAKGDSYAAIENLTGSSFNDRLTGNAGANVLTGGAGNDVLIGGGGKDTLVGGAGTDTASYAGASKGMVASLAKPSDNTNDARGDSYSAIENLTGSSFNDRLTGNAGANTLTGGAGNDLLAGGLGKDLLSGGGGQDTFLFNTKTGNGNVDRIADFNVRDDSFQLENGIFTALGKAGKLLASMFEVNNTGKAQDGNDHVIYRKATGELYYDADGSGKGSSILIAELAKNLALTHNDFFVV